MWEASEDHCKELITKFWGYITLIDDVIVNIYSGLCAEFLLQIIYLNHNHKS